MTTDKLKLWQNIKVQNCDKTQKQILWQNFKTRTMRQLKNSNCDKTQENKLWPNTKTQTVTKLKTQVVIKLKKSNCDKTKKKQIVTVVTVAVLTVVVVTVAIVISYSKNNFSQPWQLFSGQLLGLSQCFYLVDAVCRIVLATPFFFFTITIYSVYFHCWKFLDLQIVETKFNSLFMSYYYLFTPESQTHCSTQTKTQLWLVTETSSAFVRGCMMKKTKFQSKFKQI